MPAFSNDGMRFGAIERLLKPKMDEVLSASPKCDSTAESNDPR